MAILVTDLAGNVFLFHFEQMSQIVKEASLMTHINNLHPHIIRFPGGSIL
jgi:hypothetical protein